MDITANSFPGKLAAILTHISNAHFVALDFEMSGISMAKSKSDSQSHRSSIECNAGQNQTQGRPPLHSRSTSETQNLCLDCLSTPTPSTSVTDLNLDTNLAPGLCSCAGSDSAESPALSEAPSLNSSVVRKQTLQKRYDEVRCAAEKYQILQVGITVVGLDSRTGTYILRPYNISLSPLLQNNVGIERVFSMQSSSVAFLVQHGFDFQKSFAQGVHYLSRLEEEKAKLQEYLSVQQNQPQLGGSLTDAGDQEDFVKNVRSKINSWLLLENRNRFVNIGLECFDGMMQTSHVGLSNYQRRLVHQLVRVEYGGFVTESYPAYIQVRDRDELREATLAKYRATTFDSKLQRQIGLRYLMDAMTTGDSLDNLDASIWLGPTHKGQQDGDTKKNLEQFRSVKQRLRSPTVLIGHNIFTDLVNFYSCFIGKLPEDVDDFKDEIHELFPFVIDTKYLATHMGNRHGMRSGLEDLDSELKHWVSPRIDCHPHHARYTSPQLYLHEAGFDSFMTARVAIRLAAKLDASSPQVPESIPLAAKYGDVLIPRNDSPPIVKTALQELEELFSNVIMNPPRSQSQISPRIEQKLQPAFEMQKPGISPFMPSFDSDFWKTYGNRLRVNGTAEEVLVLGKWPM